MKVSTLSSEGGPGRGKNRRERIMERREGEGEGGEKRGVGREVGQGEGREE